MAVKNKTMEAITIGEKEVNNVKENVATVKKPKHYEFVECNKGIYKRLKATCEFTYENEYGDAITVKEGDLGGLVESSVHLGPNWKGWIDENSLVQDNVYLDDISSVINSVVTNDVRICGDSIIANSVIKGNVIIRDSLLKGGLSDHGERTILVKDNCEIIASMIVPSFNDVVLVMGGDFKSINSDILWTRPYYTGTLMNGKVEDEVDFQVIYMHGYKVSIFLSKNRNMSKTRKLCIESLIPNSPAVIDDEGIKTIHKMVIPFFKELGDQ